MRDVESNASPSEVVEDTSVVSIVVFFSSIRAPSLAASFSPVASTDARNLVTEENAQSVLMSALMSFPAVVARL